MSKFLANKNVPVEVVEAARQGGLDLTWIKEHSPGADDDEVLALGRAESGVLLTFDKDFGEMAFARTKPRLRVSSSFALGCEIRTIWHVSPWRY